MAKFFILIFLLFPGVFFAQICTIEGYAPDYQNQKVSLHAYEDYITYTEQDLGQAIVNDSGFFTIQYEVQDIERVFLRFAKQRGFLYAEPGRTVRVQVPRRDTQRMINPDVEYEAQLTYFTDDSTDMNFLAIDFNRHFQTFWNRNYMYFLAKSSYHKLDSFHLAMNKRYEFVKNPYFNIWMNYNLASIEDATFHPEKKLAALYLINHPIKYKNNEYMNFFNSFFKDYLYSASVTKNGSRIHPAINIWVSYDSLMAAIQPLRWLENDTMRELVMLKSIYEQYNNPAYDRGNILSIVQQTITRSKVAEHRQIARNILAQYTRFKPGVAASRFIAIDRTGKAVDVLQETQGKIVYLFFFTEWNVKAQNEMRLMSELHRKYGKKIAFVGISTGSDTAAWKKLLKENPKYTWTMLHYNFNEQIKADYDIYALPSAFLIDETGLFITIPADLPSGTIEQTMYRVANPRRKPQMIGQ
jgi:thiol-disulfide isomerase/thioredoxin